MALAATAGAQSPRRLSPRSGAAHSEAIAVLLGAWPSSDREYSSPAEPASRRAANAKGSYHRHTHPSSKFRRRTNGLDPVALRRQKHDPPAAQPCANPLGITYDGGRSQSKKHKSLVTRSIQVTVVSFISAWPSTRQRECARSLDPARSASGVHRPAGRRRDRPSAA